ncbi:MAG: multiheme c-type cytochrome [Planctomycetota bacterium]
MTARRTAIACGLSLGALTLLLEAASQGRAQDAAAPLVLAKVQETDTETFTTAGTCALCHAQSERAKAMRDAKGRGIAPYDLWQGTMMANSARDPFWRAVVSAEVAATPAAKQQIEAKCLRCHAPMASTEFKKLGADMELERLYRENAVAQLGLDGVSCTVCHQVQDKGLGQPESYSGNYSIGDGRLIYGPHKDPFFMPMRRFTGFTATEGQHVRRAALCATCHTLFTDSLDAAGKPTGQRLPEQTPYLEWRNSVFNDEGGERGMACQGCHVPVRDQDGQPIVTRIAHAPPGGDFRIDDRQPVGRHVFVGGNSLVPAILRDHRDELNPRASDEALSATAQAAREQLERRTAKVELGKVERAATGLKLAVSVSSFTGHKFPTGHPSRRAWLELVVEDAAGKVLFASGAHDQTGRLLGADGRPLPAELAGGPVHAHRQVVQRADQVVVYEAVMADAAGKPTYLLMRGGSYLKDSRLLPRGWRKDGPDAATTAPQGLGEDPDFAGGGDQVRYEVPLPESATGPLQVRVRLLYQVLGARYADELFRHDTREVRAFRRYWEQADRRPVVVAEATAKLAAAPAK